MSETPKGIGIDVSTPLLEVRDAHMQFGAVTALAGVSLRLYAGEVVALLGDNGAGKSTLVRGLSGVHQFSSGQILINGEEVKLRSPADARAAGIETVFQNLAVFDNLSVVANFFAGREVAWPHWFGGLAWMQESEMRRRAKQELDNLQVNIPSLSAHLGVMSGGQRQAIACARSTAFASRVVILDEPTAALGLRESRNVWSLVRRLAEARVGVIIISHNMEEVLHVANRAVVLRQGHLIGESDATPENQNRLVSMIMGSSASELGG
jgi:ABC-type sugar transport system ATPase subunit